MRWRALGLVLIWAGIAIVLYRQVVWLPRHIPFDAHASVANLKLLRQKKKPLLSGGYLERSLGELLVTSKLEGPVELALPPMYWDEAFGNAGFLASFITQGDAILYNGPFPHPKLEIREHMVGSSSGAPYRFDNRPGNASLYVALGDETYPFGMTAWSDMVFNQRTVRMDNPRVVDGAGRRLQPTAVRVVHPLNRVFLGTDEIMTDLRHLSPIVWTFPGEGRLVNADAGFTSEAISDGIEVSWMPPLPPPQEHPFGLFLLEPLLVQTDSYAPAWWKVDQDLRHSIVAGRPAAENRKLVEALAKSFPNHPFLAHYRVVAELGGDRFDGVWLKAQAAQCDLQTWYLVAWTQLPWSRVRTLPCLTSLPSGRLTPVGEYIAEWPVIAYHTLADDFALKMLAERVVDASYLRAEFRGFNHPPSDFAWLWLKARP